MRSKKQKNTNDWTEWFDLHGPRMLGFANSHCRSNSDAEDLLQEVITELWRKSGTSSPPDLPLVFSRIRQRAIDHARSHTQRTIREEKFTNDPSLSSEGSETEADSEHKQSVLSALHLLPERFREVVTLKLWKQLTFDQIAATLEISRGTAASRYRLALGKLKQSFKTTKPHE